MNLQRLADDSTRIRYGDLGTHRELVRDLQVRLARFGLLDPPADGMFGPVSQWALEAFLERADVADRGVVDARVARKLLGENPDALFPLAQGNGLAGRVVAAMLARGHWLCRHPRAVNVVYVEGMDPDGKANGDVPNQFNDARILLRVTDGGTPRIVDAWEATTEPGRFWTQRPMSPRGAARIAFGQYKAWGAGMHRGNHRALVQTAPVTVYRDLDKNFERNGDTTQTGHFGINQHWGYDNPRDDIGRSSAGCLVGRTKAGHRDFMSLLEKDARYVANNRYQFMTAVLDVAMLA